MNDILEQARGVLRSQPFSVLLGADVVAFSADLVEIHVPITESLTQHHGFVHGGVVSYAADNALTFAGGAALGPAVVTSEYKINYLRPARGEVLISRARIVYAGRTQAICRCDVLARTHGEDLLCAVAQGTIALLSAPK